MKLNNHGQTLVIFVLLIPLFFMVVGYVIELGQLHVTRIKYEQTITETIKYGLKHIDDEQIQTKMQKMLDVNIKGEKKITINDKNIKVTSNVKGMFKVFFKDAYEIDLTYSGYIKDGKQIIKKN